MKAASCPRRVANWLMCFAMALMPTSQVLATNRPSVSEKKVLPQREQEAQQRGPKYRAIFDKGKKMLLDHGVPFDPEILNFPEWRKALKPHFETMKEMQQEKRLSRFISGVHVADTLVLPGEVNLHGDVLSSPEIWSLKAHFVPTLMAMARATSTCIYLNQFTQE